MKRPWEPPLANSVQGNTRERSWDQNDDGQVVVRVDRDRVEGVDGYLVTVRRVGNITWWRWRQSGVSAAELFERAVERIVRGEEMGSL